jgi:murein DD-endopeptidase MepM/ murein hydrolase activator NlpD
VYTVIPPAAVLKKYQHDFHKVVPFLPGTGKLLPLDFTESNKELTAAIMEDNQLFIAYINEKLASANAVYGIGGYGEHRTVYSNSRLFDARKPGEEPRRLHLGIDIWGPAGTPVYAFMGGRVHSFAFNDNKGDYGATIVLQHQLEGISFHTLYGHLGVQDIATLSEAQYVTRGQCIGHFGTPEENGHWPPHLHFQVVIDMELKQGDYPGVCKYSEKEKYLLNCPDPDLILQMNQYIS